MSVENIAIQEKWELVYQCVDQVLSEKDYFFSFNDIGKQAYSFDELNKLAEESSVEFQEFSDLVHQIPVSGRISSASNDAMWKEYMKIFFCGIIPSKKLNLRSTSFYTANNKGFQVKEDSYLKHKDEFEKGELDLINAYNNNLDNDEIEKIKSATKEKYVKWKTAGNKDEIEKLYDKYFSESEFSYARLWSEWKTKSLQLENAGYTGIHSKFAGFYANFKNLLNNNNWREETINLHAKKNMASFSSNNLLPKLDSIKLSYQFLNITRNWLVEDVFESDFWKWHPQYNSDLLSYGMKDAENKGKLPTYIESVLFLKNIKCRARSNWFFDVLEWIGGFFKELPFEDLIPADNDNIYLVAFKTKKVVKSPNPKSNLNFN